MFGYLPMYGISHNLSKVYAMKIKLILLWLTTWNEDELKPSCGMIKRVWRSFTLETPLGRPRLLRALPARRRSANLGSRRNYPTTRTLRPLYSIFITLSSCHDLLARRPLLLCILNSCCCVRQIRIGKPIFVVVLAVYSHACALVFVYSSYIMKAQ